MPIASRPDAWNPVTMPACRFGGRRRSSRLRLALAARPTARAPPTSPLLLLLLLLLRVRAQRTLAARRGGAGDERSIYAGTPRRTGLYAILAERTTPPPPIAIPNKPTPSSEGEMVHSDEGAISAEDDEGSLVEEEVRREG